MDCEFLLSTVLLSSIGYFEFFMIATLTLRYDRREPSNVLMPADLGLELSQTRGAGTNTKNARWRPQTRGLPDRDEKIRRPRSVPDTRVRALRAN
jgi:hypothetical protein